MEIVVSIIQYTQNIKFIETQGEGEIERTSHFEPNAEITTNLHYRVIYNIQIAEELLEERVVLFKAATIPANYANIEFAKGVS